MELKFKRQEVCPICGFENVHHMKPKFKGEYSDSGADYEIIIPFWCEHGCHGFINFHHHEGLTSKEIYQVKLHKSDFEYFMSL